MKSTIVPAQITTIEDKVAGNLSLMQLVLLSTPVFIVMVIYIIAPPFLKMAAYKMVVVAIFAVVFGVLAIRVKGRILLLWAVTIATYNLRPRHFVFDKNDMHLRDCATKAPELEIEEENPDVDDEAIVIPPQLSTRETVMLERIIADPNSRLHFKTDRKGDLRVHITKDQ
jgi:hypothetical protein